MTRGLDPLPEIERRLRSAARDRPEVAGGERATAAARLLAGRAADEGLADICYSSIDSPLGLLLAAGTRRGLVLLAYEDGAKDALLTRLGARLSPRLLEAPKPLEVVRRQLDEYFAGRRRGFELPLDWSLAAGFGRRVLRATAAVPYGGVTTYGAVAARAGSPAAARAAGNALGANPMPVVVPCHRVLHSGGGLGGYTGGLDRKRHLLELEGALTP